MKNYPLSLKALMTICILCFSNSVPFAAYFTLPVSGFNADVVADIPGNASGSTTNDYDGVNYVWMSQSYNPTGSSYMPVGGLINSVVTSTPGLTFQLQPYTANNTLRLPGTSTGVLTVTSPQAAQTVYVLGSTGSGVGTATITITFTDLTTQIFTGIVFPDWYGGANYAILGMGRTNRVTNVISNDASNPRLYQAPLALLPANYGKPIQSISFSNTGGVLNIMAISIDATPIPCTGTPTAGTAVPTTSSPCVGTPFSVSLVGGSTTSGLIYQWIQGTNCTSPWLPMSGVANPSVLTPTLIINNPIAGSSIGYRCVVTCTITGLKDTSSTACVITQPWSCTTPCFPASAAINSGDQDIFNVTLSTINNTTGCTTPLIGSQGTGIGTGSMYANFAGSIAPANLNVGIPQPFSLTIGSCGGNIASSVKMYIDFNHNANFTDVGEEVYSNAGIGSVIPSMVINGNITVPFGALSGCTRLRVVMMSSWIGIVSPHGTYAYGETEDYSVNIIAPSPTDPAITSINVPSGTCFSNTETITATLCNYGSTAINLGTNPVTVSLNVLGPTGLSTYTTTVSSGILPAYGAACVTVTFIGVNLYDGGTYTINSSLTISGVANGSLVNDSLNTPILRSNYRPTGGPDYTMCQGSIIPFGQGLSVSGCATPINDSLEIIFTLDPSQPPICTSTVAAPTSACEFASAILPAVPAGSTFTNAELTVTNLASAFLGCVFCTWPNEKRFSLFSGIAPPAPLSTYFPGVLGHPGTTGADAQGYTYTNAISPSVIGTIYSTLGVGNTLKMGSWNTYNTTANNHVINYNGNPTIAKLKIYYTYVPASFEWYKDSVGGPVLYTYSPFNPIGVTGSGITNSNTPGTYPFYAACAGSSNCRVPVDLIIHPTPAVFQDTLTLCELSPGSNNAIFNLTVLDTIVSGSALGTSVSYFADQALFLPIANPTNDTSSTNFIYSRVENTSTGCYSSDSILLDVVSIPEFVSSPLFGNGCAPNSVDAASLISIFTTTVGADTLYYEDAAFTILHPNPHTILTPDSVYMVLVTNTNPACSDTAIAVINVIPATNHIVNQDTIGNYTICGPVPCGNIILSDGATETLFTTTDCRKVATIHDLSNTVALGSTQICEEIDCGQQYHNGQPYLNRHYQITPSVNDSAEVCLYYLEDDFATFNLNIFGTSWLPINPTSNVCITQVDNGDINTPGHTAVAIPNSSITATYDAATTVWKLCFKVDSFSYFYCHTCNPANAPLPIDLISFTGKRISSKSVLQWITSNESNNSHFIIERSSDGLNFSTLSQPIKSKAINGNSTVELSYQYEDAIPLNSHNYYRLRQFDIDGRSSLSKNVDVFFGDETLVSMYPNPVDDLLSIQINTPKSTIAFAKIIDLTGRTIQVIEMPLSVGRNINKINLQSLSDGIYTIDISNNKGLRYTQRIRKN